MPKKLVDVKVNGQGAKISIVRTRKKTEERIIPDISGKQNRASNGNVRHSGEGLTTSSHKKNNCAAESVRE